MGIKLDDIQGYYEIISGDVRVNIEELGVIINTKVYKDYTYEDLKMVHSMLGEYERRGEVNPLENVTPSEIEEFYKHIGQAFINKTGIEVNKECYIFRGNRRRVYYNKLYVVKFNYLKYAEMMYKGVRYFCGRRKGYKLMKGFTKNIFKVIKKEYGVKVSVIDKGIIVTTINIRLMYMYLKDKVNKEYGYDGVYK